jgi:prophage antirepressor-like protein
VSAAVQPFDFQGSEVRVLPTTDGEPWFVAADVASVLGYSEASAMTRTLDADEKGLHTLQTPGGPQDLIAISEAGLYSAILRSRVPQAQTFKRWVTHEVLPAIRRTGSFAVAMPDITTPQGVVAMAEQFLATAKELVAAREQIQEERPLVARAITHAGAEGLYTRQQFARELITWAAAEHGATIKHADVMAFLHRIGLFIAHGRSDSGQATTDAIRRGLAVTVAGTAPNGHNYGTGKLTAAGQAYAWDKAVRLIDETGALAGRPRLEVLA